VVKVLAPELAAGVNADRFEREIQLAARLQQANIVPLLATGEAAGLPYFTMPYIEGQSLRARLGKQERLPIPECLEILRDVARALSYAHASGVVHRDIKPDNVLLSHGAAMVSDFGIAKAISASREAGSENEITKTGMSLGSPAYMSPEQIAADPDVDHRADLYAFGCLGYELITGRAPFAGESPQRVLAAHLTEKPRAIAEVSPHAPAELVAVIERCLEKDPRHRPQSADEILSALASVSTTGGRISPAEQTKRTRTAKWIPAGIAALILVALGAYAATAYRSSATGDDDRSIAVLPLSNLSGDRSNDFLGEGLAGEIPHACGPARHWSQQCCHARQQGTRRSRNRARVERFKRADG
jgi:eukaryotic-like serine/threonine-protein kinase